MSIDDLLNQPLSPVRDDGFTIGLVRRLNASQQRMRLIMWGLLAAGFLPVLAILPFVDTGPYWPDGTMQWLNSQLSYPLGALILLWVWKARFSRL
ncbi:MAG: hypothetical protein RJB58_2298 [Pseudomonadota bacterium]|jgi:hypothetical protein